MQFPKLIKRFILLAIPFLAVESLAGLLMSLFYFSSFSQCNPDSLHFFCGHSFNVATPFLGFLAIVNICFFLWLFWVTYRAWKDRIRLREVMILLTAALLIFIGSFGFFSHKAFGFPDSTGSQIMGLTSTLQQYWYLVVTIIPVYLLFTVSRKMKQYISK